jgi:hypothetical protein
MDVVGLQDTAKVGLVRRARAQAFYRRVFVAEGFKERERKLRGIERLFSQRRNCLFDLNSVHFAPSRTVPKVMPAFRLPINGKLAGLGGLARL